MKPNLEWRPMTSHPAGLSHMPFCCAACAPESGSERIVWIVWDDSRNMFFCQEMGREREGAREGGRGERERASEGGREGERERERGREGGRERERESERERE